MFIFSFSDGHGVAARALLGRTNGWVLMDGIHFAVAVFWACFMCKHFCTLVAGATFWIAWGVGLLSFLSATAAVVVWGWTALVVLV